MFAFHLSNDAEIDLEGVIDAMLEIDDYPEYYLDTEIGAIVRIATAAMLGRWIEEIGRSDRYLLIPRIEDDERSILANVFIDEILTDTVSAKEVQTARAAVIEGEWELFELYLADKLPMYELLWDEFVEDHALERAHDWLTDEYIGARASFEGCGQCALCEAIARGEEDPDALLNACMTEEVMDRVREQVQEIRAQRLASEAVMAEEKKALKNPRPQEHTTSGTARAAQSLRGSLRIPSSSKKTRTRSTTSTKRKGKPSK